MIHKRSTAFERAVEITSMNALNQFHSANLALNTDVDQDTFGKVTKWWRNLETLY